jgi:chromosome segregation ATPase
MIPVWLTPQIMRLGGIFALIFAIFMGGYLTHGKIHKGRVTALENEIKALQSSYDGAIRSLERCGMNIDELEEAIRRQNEAIQVMLDESNAAIAEANRMRNEAIARERELHERAMEDMQSEYARLYQEWAALSAADACHQSWLEVTNVH